MGEVVHNKLVRDGIPGIIRADGGEPITRVLDDADYRRELLRKLVEEATELLESDGSLDERGDVEEVLRALDEHLGHDTEAIEQARADKATKRGGFMGRIFLEKVITDERTD